MNQEAEKYYDKTSSYIDTRPCSKVFIKRTDPININFYHCSENAAQKDAAITKAGPFEVPNGLGRRYSFWKRVYSIWNYNDLIIHTEKFPELVFEIGTISLEKRRYSRSYIFEVMENRKEEYYQTLMSLHKYPTEKGKKLWPERHRIALLMKHISHPNKYQIAAESLKIQRGQKQSMIIGLGRARPYLQKIEEAFLERGLPRELAKLAFVESFFSQGALSHVGATGVYQFMPQTAKRFLIVNKKIDERLDPIKSGSAAAELLAHNFAKTGSWPLAITAYNHGLYGIMRGVQVTGSADLGSLVRKYKSASFGFDSSNYYTRFLAVVNALEQEKELFKDAKQSSELEFQAFKLNEKTPISKVLKAFRMDLDEFLAWNTEINTKSVNSKDILPSGFVFKIPANKKKRNRLSVTITST